jgi:hypothetical protein
MKLYHYPNAQPHTQDELPGRANTVPFSAEGIKKHCTLTAPEDDDYFYMGQFRDAYYTSDILPLKENFPYFDKYPHKHIADIEGDWKDREVPEWLREAILTINSVDVDFKAFKVFPRPTFTVLVMDCARNRNDTFPITNNTFSFLGKLDPHGVRQKMYDAFLLGVSNGSEIGFNTKWAGLLELGHPAMQSYIDLMLKHGIALCPRGCGKDSARFYEACFFGREPVLIGDNRLLGDTEHDMSFVFRISQHWPVDEMANVLRVIADCSLEGIQERGRKAREYFDKVFRTYVSDPTEYLINRL